MSVFALVQFASRGTREANLAAALELATQAKRQGAELVCFAEFFAYPWFPFDAADRRGLAEAGDGPTVTALREFARAESIHVLGSIYERAAGRFHNQAVLIDPDGDVRGTYRKKHLPDEPGYREAAHYVPGEESLPVFETSLGRLGLQVCSDAMFPEHARVLAKKGAQVLLVPRATPVGSAERWQTVLRANAIVNGCYVLTANRAGREGELTFAADSMIVDPRGNVLARAEGTDAVVAAPVDLDLVAEVRQGYPFYIERRPEVLSELLD